MAAPLTRAGRYQIVSELGRGSMGVVYQGFDPVIGRTVAIKTMLTEGLGPAEFEDFKARFQREAQAAGVLNHPNIVTVYDFGEDSGILYLAMEFLVGKSLQEIVEEEGILPVDRIIPLYDQVCAALDHAHAHQIIHRDVKPANIMVLQSGLVKMTDFGIAKVMATGMTQAGQILGTPNYMSPEQVRGRQIDGRSDIFALGVILYELVTGEKPFGGQNITTVIYRIINENPIPPRELDSTIHPGLSYVIQKVLAKNPDERYQTCRELAEDLKNYRNLGDAVAPSATVVIRVPPVASMVGETRPVTPAKPAAVAPPVMAGEQPITRPISVQVIPPVQPQPKQSSPIGLVLLLLLVLGGLGGGYYYMFLRTPAKMQVPQTTVQPPPAPSTDTSPTSSSTQSQGDAASVQAPGATAGTGSSTTETVAPAGATPEAAQPSAAAAAVGPGLAGTPAPTQQTAPGSKPASVPSAVPAGQHPATVPASGGSRAPQQPGSLVVTSSIPGAQITVDGRTSPNWVTPFTVPDLPAGSHSVVVSKDGYNAAQRNVTVDPGRAANLSVELTAPVGEVNIETVPPGIDTQIDGQPAGKTPVQKSMGVGKHTFTLRVPGMDPYTSSFEIKYDGYIVTKRVNLGGAAAAPTGVVEVRTTPSGATVLVDGNPMGGTTPTSFRLNRGIHRLTISLAGFATVNKDVEVPADGTVSINEDLGQ